MTVSERTLRRKPTLAGLMSIFPGLGQLYNGQVYKAALFAILPVSFLLALILDSPFPPPFNIALPVFIYLAVRVAIIADAFVIARRLGDRYELKRFNKWYVYVVFLLGLFFYQTAEKAVLRSYMQAFKIPSGAMVPTLLIGDYILVAKKSYSGGKLPQRTDVIVFLFPEDETKIFIKRVIGLPGDTVEIKNKAVYINGEPLNEPYIQHVDPRMLPNQVMPRDNLGPLTLPAASYFVLGDNRDQSLDSRFWGYVKLEKITGKVRVLYWSWDTHSSEVRWERIGKTL